MSKTYYTSLSGMLAASYALQNTSNNIANIHNPGFKRSDLFYSSLGDGGHRDGVGAGVSIGGKTTNFAAGTYLETKSPSDLAIVGPGFFIVRLKNGELLYTRDGEFAFNNEGLLIDKHSGGLVQGYDEKGNLVSIRQFGPPTHKGMATRFVELTGEFVLTEKPKDTVHDPIPSSAYQNISLSLENIFDEQGKAHRLELEFESQIPLQGTDGSQWHLVRLSCDGEDIDFDRNLYIEFNMMGNGPFSATSDNNKLTFYLGKKQAITLQFGDYMTDESKAVRLKKADTNLSRTEVSVYKKDGYGEGKQIDFSFNDDGLISYRYDNGQTIEGLHLALAKFDDPEHSLVHANDNLFRATSEYGCHLGRANKDGFGSLQAYKLESANVDSTAEFANIVVLQRMFQACSQIMDIDKQLLEKLYEK